MSASSFKLGTVKIGDQNYLGNYIRYPVEGKTGVNCLLGTKTLVPIDGPVPGLPSLPSAPALPGVPAIPGAPALPALPSV